MGFSLESFDDGLPVTPQMSPEFLEGFAAGRAEAFEESLAQQQQVDEELVQVLSDTAFSFAEAQAHVLANLTPLIELVITRVLPASLSDSFGIMLRDAIAQAAREDAKRPMTLVVAPSQADKLRTLLEQSGHKHLEISTDTKLSEHAAFLSMPGTETVFDLDIVMAKVTEAIAALNAPQKRRNEIGK